MLSSHSTGCTTPMTRQLGHSVSTHEAWNAACKALPKKRVSACQHIREVILKQYTSVLCISFCDVRVLVITLLRCKHQRTATWYHDTSVPRLSGPPGACESPRDSARPHARVTSAQKERRGFIAHPQETRQLENVHRDVQMSPHEGRQKKRGIIKCAFRPSVKLHVL